MGVESPFWATPPPTAAVEDEERLALEFCREVTVDAGGRLVSDCEFGAGVIAATGVESLHIDRAVADSVAGLVGRSHWVVRR